MKINKNIIDYTQALMAIIYAMQVIMVLSQLMPVFPQTNMLHQLVLPEWRALIYPKGDLVFWLLFICLSVALSKWFSIQRKEFASGYIIIEIVLTFLMISAIYKMIIYDNSPFLAKQCFIWLTVISIITKIFYKYLLRLFSCIFRLLNPYQAVNKFLIAGDVTIVTLIVLLIYIPHLERIVSLSFIGEQWHHLDFFIMSPGWASLNGQLPYIGVISQYGVGVPIILSNVMKILGGFNYLLFMQLAVAFAIVYYILVYVLMRYWINSRLWALAMVLVTFKLQMFHYGVSPLVWIYPSTTPLRFGFDIGWIGLLLIHLKTAHWRYLILAGIYSGFALFYMTSTGMCILVSMMVYLVALLVIPSLRKRYAPLIKDRLIIIGIGVLSILTTGISYYLALGNEIFKPLFWHNMTEYLIFFAHGHAGGVIPMYESLKYRHYWAWAMSLMMPLTYMFTALISVQEIVRYQRQTTLMMLVLLSVYGLLNYQYYIVRSAVTSYYINALPWVMIGCWIIVWLMRHYGVDKLKFRLIAVSICFYALMTNHNYISYPNMLNFSKNPLVDIMVAQRYPDRQGYFNHLVKGIKEEDKLPVNALGDKNEDLRTEDSFKNDQELLMYVKQESDFSIDAQLIQQLTNVNESVALLSSFETAILIQAKRKPFFYHFPLISSQPMRMRSFPADAAHSPNFLKDTMQQLVSAKPTYIFIHKIFLQDNLPLSYLENNVNIVAINEYIRKQYSPYQYGKYLVAMKRKE